jgi:hypothetical protein
MDTVPEIEALMDRGWDHSGFCVSIKIRTGIDHAQDIAFSYREHESHLRDLIRDEDRVHSAVLELDRSSKSSI